jgi:hypothetical protein
MGAMDPIQPLGHGPLAPIARRERRPVDRAEPISRERDRPEHEQERRRRKEAEDATQPPEDEDGHPHIDVRA